MRVARVLGVVAAAVVLVAAVLAAGRGPSRATDAPPERRAPEAPAQAAPPRPVGTPVAAGRDIRFCEDEQACRAVRERAVLELTTRLRADPAAHAGAQTGADEIEAGVRAARRRQRDLCPVVRRNECSLAVASSAIRRQWRLLRRRASRRGTAEVLVGVGARLGLTGTQVTNAVRAELDTELTRAVDRGRMPTRAYGAALSCFDELRDCGAVG